jgi:type IV secretion system protein TrbJ
MKFNLTKRRKYILTGAIVLATATPSFALLGFGDIVFDPSNYAQAISQVRALTSMLSTATNQYNTIKSNVQNFSFKNLWKTQVNSVKTAFVPNTFGETNGMSSALNLNSVTAAATAWTSSNVALNSSTHTMLSTQAVGNSVQLSQLAMIESSDSVSPDCLNAVGAYRAARAASLAAEANLQNQQLDGTSATNSEVEQLNLLNVAQAQAMNEQQTQGVLHACIASQMTVANMQQRNAAAQDLNTWAFVKQQAAANPTDAVGSSGTWTSYVP